MPPRNILHVDMDAFFAAVEVLDNPRLAGKPVIVGGTPEGHGVVSTASYEARKYGIHSAMPANEARRRCPHGVFLPPRAARYAEISRQVFAIFKQVTPLVEPLSIDEAFLDVTGCPDPEGPEGEALPPGGEGAAVRLAREIQRRVEAETGGLTCSVGVAENKFLAKIASDLRKPRGLVVVPRGRAREFLAPLPVERLWGVGPRTAARLHELNLSVVADIARLEARSLTALLGEDIGLHLHRLSRGVDNRPVITDWESRSISQERTFGEFIAPEDNAAIEGVLFALCDKVAFRLRREGFWSRTVHLKVRDETFHTVTRARTLGSATQLVEDIYEAVVGLFRDRVKLAGRKVRLLGVGATGLVREPARQLELFGPAETTRKRARLLAHLSDAIRDKLGDGAIIRGRLLEDRRKQEP